MTVEQSYAKSNPPCESDYKLLEYFSCPFETLKVPMLCVMLTECILIRSKTISSQDLGRLKINRGKGCYCYSPSKNDKNKEADHEGDGTDTNDQWHQTQSQNLSQ